MNSTPDTDILSWRSLATPPFGPLVVVGHVAVFVHVEYVLQDVYSLVIVLRLLVVEHFPEYWSTGHGAGTYRRPRNPY